MADVPAPADHVLLRALRWTRLRCAVRNLHAAEAREHPLWILHALLMFAVPPEAKDGRSRFTFRPLVATGDTIQRDQVYPLEILFPGDDLTLAQTCAKGLEQHLADPRHHFALVGLEPPQVRCLADLEQTSPPWPEDLDEVCLEFQTPLAYTPAHPARPARLDALQLGALVAHRIRHFFIQPPPSPGEHWTRLRTLWAYWRFVEYPHQARSGAGVKTIAGNVGPLYLRGRPAELAAVRPWLLLASEIGAGLKLGPRGHFTLRFHRPFFDPVFGDPATYTRALDDLQQRADLPEDFPRQLGAEEQAVRELAAAVAAGQWTPAPAQGFRAVKAGGIGERLLVQLPARDRLLHQALQIHLTPWWDRLLEPQSHGYRPGRGLLTARQVLHEAWSRGYTLAVEADLEAFFDSVDWDLMAARLDEALPRADVRTRAVLHALLRTPVRLNRRPVHRTRGLLQGSPLSPLLANLYLDPFDEEMTRRGFLLVRYADDFVLLARDEAEAQAALAAAREVLAGLRLTLQDRKTAITPFAAGFTFLGLRLGGTMEPEFLEDAALQKTLYLRHPHAWVGVDQDAVVVRQGGRLLARVPFRRVRELVLLGAGGLSARLIERCAARDLAIAICTASGRLQNVLWRHDRTRYDRLCAHARTFARLPAATHLAIARAFVAAKLHNYLAWFAERTPAEHRPIVDALRAAQRLLAEARDLDAIRGVEGMAARDLFRHINDRAPAAFHSPARRPHEQPDAWNLLLDFAYALLFHRLNTLVRLRGLHPYLGFLHSARDRFEALVCDLQEPFRARCDRFVLNLVNRGQLTPAHFETDPCTGGPRLTPPGVAVFIEGFARALDTRLAADPVTWGKALEAQVLALQRWVERDEPVRVFCSGPAPDAAMPLTWD